MKLTIFGKCENLPIFDNLIAESQLRASKAITTPLKKMIVEQSEQFTKPQLQSVKSALHREKCQANTAKAEQVKGEISSTLQRTMDLGTEKGASTWLTALPLQEQGFTLNKQEFQDALCLRYGWQLKNLPSHCVCGSVFSIDHAMTCSHGGLIIIRHNDIRDITANWLSEVCRNVESEPPLLPLTGENIVPLSANRRDDARADIRATGFWGRQQCAFFDVRVFHPNAQSYHHSSISSLYRRHELAKKREYGDRMVPSLHLFLPQPEAWLGRLHCYTSVLWIKYPKKRIPCTVKPWHGLGAPFPSPFYDLQ